MATNGWIGEQTVHSWGTYSSRLTTNVYINGIRRYSDHIDVSGVIYLFCKSSGARTVWYDWAITAWCGGGSLGQIKPRTYNNNILGKSWSKNFSIRINCSNSATSATFQVGFSDSNMGGKDKYWTLYFDRYATSPSGISSTATYTQYSTISTSCSGINWGQGYSNRSLTCTASYTYNGKTENFTLGTWTDGATSKTVTKSDFNFPADLNVTVKWTASTNIGSTSSTSQIRVKQTFPAPNLSNTTFTAESTAPYCIRVNVSGVDFGDNYSAQKLELYGTYELDGIIYDNKLGEISNQTSWTLEYDASQEAEPWTKIPDDSSILLRLVADNGNRTSDKTIIINCQSSYEAYVIESIPEEEKEKSEVYTGKNIQIQNAPKDAPLADFKLDGETSQKSYSGKNLCGIPDQTFTHVGVTVTIKDNEITLNGTANGTGTKNISLIKSTVLNGNYTTNLIYVSGTTSNSSANINLRRTTDHTLVSGTQTDVRANNNYRTYSVSNESVELGLYINPNGAVFNNLKFKVQVVAGSVADYNFEIYVGGISAPNPDYPQEVSTVTGENTVKIRGKNLLKLPSAGTSGGITYSVNSDGTFNVHGTNNSGYEILFSLYLDSGEFQSVDYTLGAREALPYGLGCRCEIYRGGTWKRSFVSVNSTRQTQTGTPDFTDANRVRVAITIANGATVNIDNVGIQLELGSSASSFEPYQGQSYEVNLGKNLFDAANANIKTGYILNDSGTEVSDNTGGYTRNYSVVEPNTTYTISGLINAGTRRIYYYDGAKNFISRSAGNGSSSWQFTTPANCHFVNVQIYTNRDDAAAMAVWQIELGSSATSYAAYFTPIELCKIGTYQDYIWKDGDTWKVHKEVGHTIKDINILGMAANNNTGTTIVSGNGAFVLASWDWGSDYASTAGRMLMSANIGVYKYDSSLTANAGAQTMADGTFCQRQGTNDRIYFRDTAAIGKTGDQMKAILLQNGGGFDAWYSLATPNDTEITNEALIAQLEAVLGGHTYAGTNNITTITPNEQGTLEIQYYTKWQNTSPAILSANGRNGTGNFKQIRRIGTK